MARTDKLTSGNRIFNGTYVQGWLDGDVLYEATALSAKIAVNKQDVYLPRQFMADTKVMSAKGTGSLTMSKVNSRMLLLMQEMIQNGRDVRHTIVSLLDDPDAYGYERVALYGVSFDDLTVTDWTNNSMLSFEAPFTFTSFELLDAVEA